MYQTILFKAPGKPNNKPVVILSGLAYGRKCSTNHFPGAGKMLSRTLSSAWNWTRCNCTPRNIFRVLFCEKASMAVGAVVVAAMWWHSASINNTLEAQKAVGTDCLYALPWGIVWAVRATLADFKTVKKGGCNARV